MERAGGDMPHCLQDRLKTTGSILSLAFSAISRGVTMSAVKQPPYYHVRKVILATVFCVLFLATSSDLLHDFSHNLIDGFKGPSQNGKLAVELEAG